MKESGEFFIGGRREREGGGGEVREREKGGEERERWGGRGYTSLPALGVPHHFIIITTSLLIYKG